MTLLLLLVTAWVALGLSTALFVRNVGMPRLECYDHGVKVSICWDCRHGGYRMTAWWWLFHILLWPADWIYLIFSACVRAALLIARIEF